MVIEKPYKPALRTSFVGWLGGKTKLSTMIANCTPDHRTWVDIFSGSGILFFAKEPSPIEIINDIHGELVNLMKVISGTYFDESIRQEFIGYVRNMPASRAAFEEWKHWKEDKLSTLTPAQRAFVFYYCVKKSFSCTITGGYEASPFAHSRLNMSTDFEPFTERFRQTNAQIENMDFRDLVEKYNKMGASVHFFIDPPYFVANDSNYYKYVFTLEDHNDLKKCCDDIDGNGNTFLVTYDDVSEVIDLYKKYHIYRTDPIFYKSAQEFGERSLKKSELMITNYDIAKMIKERNKKHTDIFHTQEADDDVIEIKDNMRISRVN